MPLRWLGGLRGDPWLCDPASRRVCLYRGRTDDPVHLVPPESSAQGAGSTDRPASWTRVGPALHSASLRPIATRAPTVLAGLLAGGAGLFALLLAHRVGWLAVLLALVGVAAALVLLERPGVLVGAAVVATVLVEGRDATQILPDAADIYEPVAGGLVPLEMLTILILLAVAVEVV